MLLAPLVLALLCGAGACSEPNKPTAEYAQAQAAYKKAMAEHPDPSYGHPAYAEVIQLFKTVPPSNRIEYKTAQKIAADMEEARIKAMREKAINEREVERYARDQQVATEASRTASRVQTQCVESCNSDFNSCMAASGCTTTERGSIRCTDRQSRNKRLVCRRLAAECRRPCRRLGEEAAQAVVDKNKGAPL
jgi:hypothetical protein